MRRSAVPLSHAPARLATWLGVALLVLTSFLVGAQSAPTPSHEASTVLRIAVCQTFCIDGDVEGNLRRIAYAVEAAARQGAAVACFPEACVIGWINPNAHELAQPIPGALSNRIAALAKKHEIMIAIGVCEKDGDALHDSAILVSADGEILLKHRKINVLSELMTPPYARGSIEDIRVVETPIGRVGMLICADVFKNEIVAASAAQKPDVLLIPYGWAAETSEWPEHGTELAAWVAHTAKRAGCPVVGADLVGAISTGPWKGKTYGGQSVVCDENGKVLAVLRDRDAEVRVVELALRRSVQDGI
jgi:predicted amidohydrolase